MEQDQRAKENAAGDPLPFSKCSLLRFLTLVKCCAKVIGLRTSGRGAVNLSRSTQEARLVSLGLHRATPQVRLGLFQTYPFRIAPFGSAGRVSFSHGPVVNRKNNNMSTGQ